MRGSGTHPPTAALFPSPIHAKFSEPWKLRKALCQKTFNSYPLKIHPHDLQKSHILVAHQPRYGLLEWDRRLPPRLPEPD
jgi:hypothetical protein